MKPWKGKGQDLALLLLLLLLSRFSCVRLCSRAAPGKSGLHARGEGERVLALESREGTRASRRLEEGLSRSLSGGGVFEIASKYCILDSFVDHDGYSISSKGFLPAVVDIMVI